MGGLDVAASCGPGRSSLGLVGLLFPGIPLGLLPRASLHPWGEVRAQWVPGEGERLKSHPPANDTHLAQPGGSLRLLKDRRWPRVLDYAEAGLGAASPTSCFPLFRWLLFGSQVRTSSILRSQALYLLLSSLLPRRCSSFAVATPTSSTTDTRTKLSLLRIAISFELSPYPHTYRHRCLGTKHNLLSSQR